MSASKHDQIAIELHFLLTIRDEWPPVALEGVLCTEVEGGYRIDEPPLFVKGISCGDVIAVSRNSEGDVLSWTHIQRSGRTTIWLLRTGKADNTAEVLSKLHSLNCKTAQLPQFGCYSVDVPKECAIADVDSCLAQLNTESVAVAYPSFRHDE